VKRPLAVALTGGIAAGKSEALAAFARHGAATASADALVHDLLAHDEEVRAAIRARFGDDAVDDRARIGAIVFYDPAVLEWLEQLLHPRVVRAQQEWLRHVTQRIAVVEIPLLYETGGDARFDKVVVVTAPRDVRAARRDGFAAREARLLPDDEKVRRADFSYVNDGTLEQLDGFVADVVHRLTSS
jgi:dephospho-CoA kinase